MYAMEISYDEEKMSVLGLSNVQDKAMQKKLSKTSNAFHF